MSDDDFDAPILLTSFGGRIARNRPAVGTPFGFDLVRGHAPLGQRLTRTFGARLRQFDIGWIRLGQSALDGHVIGVAGHMN